MSILPMTDPYSKDYPLWSLAMHAGDSTPGTRRDAFAAELRVIADAIERRGDKGLDLDPGETADWLRAEADRAESTTSNTP
jgi:hypothetical protein